MRTRTQYSVPTDGLYKVEGIFTITLITSWQPSKDGLLETAVRSLKEVDLRLPWNGKCPVTKVSGSMYGNCPFGNVTDCHQVGQTNLWEGVVVLTVRPIDMELSWPRAHAYEKYLRTLAIELFEVPAVEKLNLRFNLSRPSFKIE